MNLTEFVRGRADAFFAADPQKRTVTITVEGNSNTDINTAVRHVPRGRNWTAKKTSDGKGIVVTRRGA